MASDGVTVFVSAEVLAGDDGHVTSDYSGDFLHLSEAGYERLNESIRKFIEPMVALTHSEATSKTARAEQNGVDQAATR
ncbi:MAG: hypothetical protein QM496_10685 [Verrucomicrobiota bacterium]